MDTRYVTNHKVFLQTTVKKPLRRKLRNVVLDLLSFNIQNGRLSNTPRIQFLLFHHVFLDEEKGLVDLLVILQKQFTFISYSDAIERIKNNNIDKPYLCFSSDDGFYNNMRASEILSSFGASACFFVCPALIGETEYDRIEKFNRSRLGFPPMKFMNWQNIEDLLKNGHEIGGHTMNHVNLNKVSTAIAKQEIVESYLKLKEKIGNVSHFAWPYGQLSHINSDVINIVFKSGYESCASGIRGCHLKKRECNLNVFQSKEIIFRDNIEFNWPTNHILYFLKNNISL